MRVLAPLLASVALMPAVGSTDPTALRDCASEWAARWWPATHGVPHDVGHAPCAAPDSAGEGLLYAFSRRRVAFVALSGVHPVGPGSAQLSSIERLAHEARASGMEWVVAYGEMPSGLGAESVQAMLRGVVDVCLLGPQRTGRVLDPQHTALLGKEGATTLVALGDASGGDDAYVRLEVVSSLEGAGEHGTSLRLEIVRARDGHVVKAFVLHQGAHTSPEQRSRSR
jgi:hypothetical protein